MGPDTETVYNDNGAGQSKLPYRFDLIDGPALFKMAEVLSSGADKYGADNWRGIAVRDHLNHLIAHAYAYLSGDTTDDHLSHIMCRAMFAQACDIQDQNQRQYVDSQPTQQVWPHQIPQQREVAIDADAMERIRQTTPAMELGHYGNLTNPRYTSQYNSMEWELTSSGWQMVRRFDTQRSIDGA
jgi:hypothetical protein